MSNDCEEGDEFYRPSPTDCSHIDDFYESLKASAQYEPIISQKTVGLFGGTRASYSVPTSGGFVKVRCDQGINTFNWAALDIMFLGSMRGSMGGNAGRVSSEGSSFLACSITPLDSNGLLKVTTFTTTATVQLPYPQLK